VTAERSPAALLPRVALGEEAAFEECVRRYGNFVYSIARRYSKDERDAEDASQEIFMALWRNAGSFDASRGTEPTFVALIARRRLIDRQRTPGTRPLPVVDPAPELSTSAVESYVDARAAAVALAGCKDEQRRVIVLSALYGLTYEEISEQLALPLGTVKSLYYRGIDRVKRALTRGEAKS
jgi:RNA polymerase sigma factor (sigma-70 family)